MLQRKTLCFEQNSCIGYLCHTTRLMPSRVKPRGLPMLYFSKSRAIRLHWNRFGLCASGLTYLYCLKSLPVSSHRYDNLRSDFNSGVGISVYAASNNGTVNNELQWTSKAGAVFYPGNLSGIHEGPHSG
jgi:hypothetical protein